MTLLAERVFEFWFGNVNGLSLSNPLEGRFYKLWFTADIAVDADIKKCFSEDLLNINTFIKDDDSSTILAKVIVLDQFSRNIHRDTPAMFEHDSKAMEIAKKAVNEGIDKEIKHPLMRTFLYMPFMHSESLADQVEGMALFKKAYLEEPDQSLFKGNLKGSCDFMEKHYRIIERFGRFPHRNQILGRVSSVEEVEYLASGGETFDSRK